MFEPPAAPRPPRLLDDPNALPACDASDAIADASGSWEGCVVSGDAVGAELDELEVSRAVLRDLYLTGSQLEDSVFDDVLIERCELSGVVAHDARWSRVRFVDCRLSGIDLAGARLVDVSMEGCRLDGANLRMIEANRLRFTTCDLGGTDLYGARAEALVMTGCDLRGIQLAKARLGRVDLAGSRLEDIVGADRLTGARIDADQVVPLGLSLVRALDVTVTDPGDA